MDLLGFGRLVRSDAAAAQIVRRFCHGKSTRIRCPGCEAAWPYHLHEGRYRCRRCRHTFGLLTGRWMARCRLAPRTWLWLIKLFELEVTALQAARQAGVSYPTALRAFTTLRRALLSQAAPDLLTHAVEVDESYFGPSRSRPFRFQLPKRCVRFTRRLGFLRRLEDDPRARPVGRDSRTKRPTGAPVNKVLGHSPAERLARGRLTFAAAARASASFA